MRKPIQSVLLLFLLQINLTIQWCLKQTYYEITSQIYEVDWSPNGQYLAVCGKSKRVTVISTVTSNVIWFDTLPNEVNTAKFSKTGKWLAIGQSNTDTVRIYNVPDFTLNMSFSAQHQSSSNTIWQLDFNSDDSKIATCASDGYVNQRTIGNANPDWKGVVSSGKDVITCKYSITNRIGCYCDGQMWLLKSDGTIDEKQGKNAVRDVDFRPDGHKYLYGGCTCDNKLYQFDTNADNINGGSYNSKDKLWAVSHSKDTTFIATGGQNGHFYIINSTNRGSMSLQFYNQNTDTDINSVRVSDDNNYVAVSRVDGSIDIYYRTCMMCPPGYYSSNTSECRLCTLDIVGCATCKNSSICYSCLNGYYYDSTGKNCTICEKVLDGCSVCKNSTVCIKCTGMYYLSGNGCVKCRLLTPQCEECQNNTCIKCSYMTYLTASNTCQLCNLTIPNCRQCYPQYNLSSPTNSTLYCRQCSSGYYALATQCLPCSSNCIMCTPSSCLACAQQYRIVGTTCSKCSQYCQACNETNYCFQCIPTTYLNNGACTVCTYPCLTCVTAGTTCKSCALGFYLNGSTCNKCVGCPLCNPLTGACTVCPIGRYLSGVNTCSYCLNTTSHCAICSASGCEACQRNYYLSGTTCLLTASITDCQIYKKDSTTVCQHCQMGLYLDNSGVCQRCSSPCADCENSTFCTECQLGYYMATNWSCQACASNCRTCNSSTECISCGDQYYLSGTQCLKCWDSISYCNSCLNQTHCLDCYLGYQLAANSLSCTACVTPCATCNSTGCLSCQKGYFYSANSCTRCPGNCSSCSSLLICSACVAGYALNSTNMCVPCQILFPNCLSCSYTACSVCKPYFLLDSSNNCVNCTTNITNCLVCNNSGLCSMCVVGFYPASNKLSCINCTVSIPNCQKCTNSSYCDECLTGFYPSSPTPSQCSKCPSGCRICSTASTCDICDSGFVKIAGNVCQACNQKVLGCWKCDSNGCSHCSIGYYRASSTSCLLCRSAMDGCIACSSGTVCLSCDSGYFLNSTNKCQKCSSAYGCETCNQTTGTCLDCISGYYLNSSSQCQLCSLLSPSCQLCTTTNCLRCQTGFYLTSPTPPSCSLCSSFIPSCINCLNNGSCLQCQSGYYLTTGGNCSLCSLTGCQVCSPTGTTCLSCENLYYRTGSTCSLCSSMDFGCVSCLTVNSCLTCKTGYYLHTNGTCLRCSTKFTACQVCSSTQCFTCNSNYFQNLSSPSGNCLLCNSFLPGCALCIDQSQCLVCQSGYFLTSSPSSCQSCTSISSCLICQDNTTCLFCSVGTYLLNGQCLSCSAAIVGCFSCDSPALCLTCSGSYTLAGGICVQVKGTPPEKYGEVKVVSEYVNGTHLKHVLYSIGIQFVQIQQSWSAVTKIQLVLPPNNKTTLTILSTQWGKSIPLNSLIFFTNNPFGQLSNSSSSSNLPFIINNFSSRRLLLTLDQLNMKINFNLKKAALSEILPALDTNNQDLSLQYSLSQPQFYKSVIANQRYHYYIFGVVVVCLFIFGYGLKVCCVVPNTTDCGEIIGHVQLTRVCAMVIYPTLGGYINYCRGFGYADLPWLNDYFSEKLSNLSDQSPNSLKMFYNNLNIASTYMLALCVFAGIYIPLILYEYYQYRKQLSSERMIKIQKFRSSSSSFSSDEKKSQPQQQPVNRIQTFRSLVYNIFISGLAFSSFSNIIGMFLNPSSVVSLPGFFYILGTILFIILLLDAIKSFMSTKIRFSKLRIVLKSSLMSLLPWSPIPTFSAMALLDIFIMLYEYRLKAKQWVMPKIWIVSNILCIVNYAALIFMSNMLLGIIVSACCILVMMGFDGYLQYAEFMQYEKIKDLRVKCQEAGESNLTIVGLFNNTNTTEKDLDREGVKNFYFQEKDEKEDGDNVNNSRALMREKLKNKKTKESGITNTVASSTMKNSTFGSQFNKNRRYYDEKQQVKVNKVDSQYFISKDLYR